MPVQYADKGALASHQHTRNRCSLFDVSHMLQVTAPLTTLYYVYPPKVQSHVNQPSQCQTRVWGRDRVAFMESLTVADVERMKPNTGALTVFTNDNGTVKSLSVK